MAEKMSLASDKPFPWLGKWVLYKASNRCMRHYVGKGMQHDVFPKNHHDI